MTDPWTQDDGRNCEQVCSVCMHAQLLQSCPTSGGSMNCCPPTSSVHGFSRQEFRVGCHFLLLGIFLTCLLLLLLLLSCFSFVQLCATPETAAHQAPLSLGFFRQEHWSGLPFPSPMHESEVAQSCPTLSNPMDCSLPGSSIHRIFQARVLEWSAIAFSV